MGMYQTQLNIIGLLLMGLYTTQVIIIIIIIIIIITLFNEGYIIKLNKLIYIMAFKTTHTHQSYISWTS